MSKVSDSYESVLKGVSQQVPQARLSGQHYEQVNMVSDPVNGLARRHGSVTRDERDEAFQMTPARIGYARGYREYPVFIGDDTYSFVYQSQPRPAAEGMPFAFMFSHTTGKFLDVVLADEAGLAPWINGGVSAVTLAGQYLVLAARGMNTQYAVDDQYAAKLGYAVAQVRGGQYSRTYTVKVTSGGTTYTASYTTMASSYPNLLDTSDIPSSDPDYQKKVNDRVNSYNSAVNQWIGQAAADIQPQNIAAKLSAALTAAGWAAAHHTTVGGTVVMDSVDSLSVTDSGDGSLIVGVHKTVDDVNKLSGVHMPGKVVQVQPDGGDPYYMVAVGDTDQSLTWQTVTWQEGPAQKVSPGLVFALGAISEDKMTLYLGSTAAALSTASGFDVPGFASSSASDLDETGALPYFLGKEVSHLTMFQDRLVVACGGTVFMSRVGDYFNWFRKSQLTVADDDPIEAYALGSGDDTISRSVTYSKDLFMFGVRNQYTISGRAQVTPATIAITTTANDRDATNAAPAVVGNLLFYGKYESAPNQDGPSPYATSVNQFQLGLFQDQPETFKVTQQLSLYMRGKPIGLRTMSAPTTVFTRTDGYDQGLYVYSFIDQPGTQNRLLESWSRWEWDPKVGQIIGFTTYQSTLVVFVLRAKGSTTWVGAEQFVMDASLAADPYLDMHRPASQYQSNTGFLQNQDTDKTNAFVAAGLAAGDLALLGTDAAQFDDFWTNVLGADPSVAANVGVGYSSYTTLTPPFIRDKNQKAIVNGRLVVNNYTVSVADTAGLDATLTAMGKDHLVKSFNGRLVGHSNNQVGRQPVTSANINVPCGRSNMEHQITLASRFWLPLAVTAVEWTGQFFDNTRRV